MDIAFFRPNFKELDIMNSKLRMSHLANELGTKFEKIVMSLRLHKFLKMRAWCMKVFVVLSGNWLRLA